MDNNTLALYIHELRNQCMFTEGAMGLFNQSLEKQAKVGAFLAAQALLTSASQVARLLWPVRAKARRRGEQLRQVLGLGEDHPLNQRQLLALWDHADERMEDWLARTKGQYIVFDFIGPKAQLPDTSVADSNIFRLFDPESRQFLYRGESYDLQAVLGGVADVSQRVNQIHDQFFPKEKAPDAGEQEQ